ncbi:hypothetical protein EV696_10992 [Permianibacter aggregans]|uniref:Uncharacterized protein n=2 Tax=Permianibacter aggregans TaxID=1510150 RepID=A0A4R6UL10_9GAMM|nr:hypothetical protein EV696_10992 [Permianibacter aggregans]
MSSGHFFPPSADRMIPRRGVDYALQTSPAAQFYFAEEWIGIDPERPLSLPFWLAAPVQLRQVELQPEHQTIRLSNGEVHPFRLIDALASNPTFVNEQTLRFYSQRKLSLRGEWLDQTFIIRTMWPEDWRISDAAAPASSWRQVVKDGIAGATKPFQLSRLWQRLQGEAPQYFLGLVLNGAQGDDDEAHGGHFGLVFGDWQAHGDISQWWVANFYDPDVVSEKGILPAITTLDNYLTDLNCGQQQYRPSWLVGCALSNPLPIQRVYAAMHETMSALYSHAFVYQHTSNNCTGLSMDALRYAGLNVPMKGPSSRMLSPLLFLYKLIQERDWHSAKKAFHYFNMERTRLLPYTAFKQSIRYLMQIVSGKQVPGTELEAALLTATSAVYGMHFPQIPSARPFGREPVSSVFQYQSRVPAKREDWKIIPVPPRPFPEQLRS